MRKFRTIAAAALLLIFTGNAVALLGPFASLVVRMGGTPTLSEMLVASSVAVGSLIAFVNVSKPDFSTPNLTVQLAPDAPLPTPDGWTASTGNAGTGGKPTPPSSTTPSAGWKSSLGAGCPSNNCAIMETALESCVQAHPGHTGHNLQSFVANPPSPWPYGHYQCRNGTNQFLSDINSYQVCKSGYTLSGGNCILANAAIVQKPADGVCNIIRTGNTYSIDPQDNADCSGQSAVSINGGTATVNALNGDTVIAMINGTTAGQSLVWKKYNPDGGGTGVPTTDTRTFDLSAPKTGNGSGTGLNGVSVNGIGFSSQKGAGTLAGTGGEGETPGGCGAPDQPKCDVKVDETGTPTDSSLQAQKDDFEAKSNEHKGMIESIAGANQRTSLGLSLSINWPAVACSDPVFPIPGTGKSLTVDLCSRSADIRDALSWFLGWATAIYIFFLGAGALRQG